jgi:hypothetical protein
MTIVGGTTRRFTFCTLPPLPYPRRWFVSAVWARYTARRCRFRPGGLAWRDRG